MLKIESFPLKHIYFYNGKSSRKSQFPQNQGPVTIVTRLLSWTPLGWGLMRSQWASMTSQNLGCHKGLSEQQGAEHRALTGRAGH